MIQTYVWRKFDVSESCIHSLYSGGEILEFDLGRIWEMFVHLLRGINQIVEQYPISSSELKKKKIYYSIQKVN